MAYLKTYLLPLDLWSDELPAKLVLEEHAAEIRSRLEWLGKNKSLEQQLKHLFDKIVDYEARLEKALADKVEKMLVLREEVEQEYADRMDELRNMYKEEMSNQVGLENEIIDRILITIFIVIPG